MQFRGALCHIRITSAYDVEDHHNITAAAAAIHPVDVNLRLYGQP